MLSIKTAVTLFALTSVLEFGSAVAALGYTIQPSLGQQYAQPKSNPLPTTGNDLFQQGLNKQDGEDYAGAISDYTEFLKTHPYHLEAYSNRGFARAMENDLKGSIADLDRAIDLSPANADVYNARGNVNAMAGNLTSSVRDFNKAIRLDRNFADAYYNRALSLHGLGDRRGAKSDLSRAAKLFHQQRDIGGYQQAREWIDKLR
jgi:tetratricopeptide (TPR) repeat protein